MRSPLRKQQKNLRKTSVTTDDVDELSKYKDNSKVLQLLFNVNKQFDILAECNTFICQNRTDFINKHKPVFDNEKLVLINIKNITEKLVASGLKVQMNDTTFGYNNIQVLDTTTYFEDWNKGANCINNLIQKILFENKKEQTIVKILKSSQKVTKKRSRNCKFWCVLVVLLILIIGCVVWYECNWSNQ